jgi:hypothetical protein
MSGACSLSTFEQRTCSIELVHGSSMGGPRLNLCRSGNSSYDYIICLCI